MIVIRPSVPGEEARQRELWKICFHDEDEYISLYYGSCYRPEEVLVLLEDDVIRSMVICLPVSVLTPDGKRHRAAYFYALATDPISRGKGYAKQLLAFAYDHLASLGHELGLTVPAMPSLFAFFQSAGLSPRFYFDEKRFTADGAPGEALVRPVGHEEYASFRDGFLAGSFSVLYPEDQILWQKRASKLADSDLYAIESSDFRAFAAAELGEDGLPLLKEFLCPPAFQKAAAAALLKSLKKRSLLARLPILGAELPPDAHRFGSIRWYDSALEQAYGGLPFGYLGLAFD
ncbi:MAG: GNAT family N-acetyltransferase [Christensenellaceae bacterium]|jgi:GNAT superfamily N-acetyltransferase|nr:GNAT family N-acetyltransferase [Christensenellaceae bacterium]